MSIGTYAGESQSDSDLSPLAEELPGFYHAKAGRISSNFYHAKPGRISSNNEKHGTETVNMGQSQAQHSPEGDDPGEDTL